MITWKVYSLVNHREIILQEFTYMWQCQIDSVLTYTSTAKVFISNSSIWFSIWAFSVSSFSIIFPSCEVMKKHSQWYGPNWGRVTTTYRKKWGPVFPAWGQGWGTRYNNLSLRSPTLLNAWKIRTVKGVTSLMTICNTDINKHILLLELWTKPYIGALWFFILHNFFAINHFDCY